jgi:RNA polymerase sigma factor (sigma-70 family)
MYESDPILHIEYSELRDALYAAIETLPKQQKNIVKARFFDGLSRNKIGKRYKLSGTRIAQIEQKAIRAMRYPAKLEKVIETNFYFQPKTTRLR